MSRVMEFVDLGGRQVPAWGGVCAVCAWFRLCVFTRSRLGAEDNGAQAQPVRYWVQFPDVCALVDRWTGEIWWRFARMGILLLCVVVVLLPAGASFQMIPSVPSLGWLMW